MALKKFLFMDGTYGYQHEQDSTDGLQLPSLVIGSGAESSGNISLSGTGKIVSLVDGTDAQDAVTKSQLDAAIAGYEWKAPVSVLKIKSDVAQSSTPPTAGAAGEAWVVNTWGGTYNDGDIVEWDGTQWNVVVTNSSGEPPDGTRVAVIATGAAGSFSGQANKIGVYDATANTWSFTAPTDGDAVMVAGENSVYENLGFVYDTGTGWVAFTGPSTIPDATSASGGGVKGKVTFDSDKGLSVAAGVAEVAIAADGAVVFNGSGQLAVQPDNDLGIGISDNKIVARLAAAGTGTGGLEFDGSGQMQVDVNAAGGLELTNDGIGANVDTTTIAINGSNELYATGAAPAPRLEKSLAVGEAIAKADPVYFSANDTVSKADAATEAKGRTVGIARTAIASGSGPICFAGLCAGVLSSATFNTPYYLASGGGLTTTRPTGNVRIVRIGYAVSATDLMVQIMDFGRSVA